MARYKIRAAGGVIDQDNGGALVKPDKSSPAWREYLQWRKAGNAPDPADAPAPGPAPEPIDYSSLDNAGKALMALGLLMKTYCNALQAGTYTARTNAQLKADFKAVWDSLP